MLDIAVLSKEYPFLDSAMAEHEWKVIQDRADDDLGGYFHRYVKRLLLTILSLRQLPSPNLKDVTDQVECGPIDDELLVITRCVCGKEFTVWDFSISIYYEAPYNTHQCPACNRKLVFSNRIHVYEVIS